MTPALPIAPLSFTCVFKTSHFKRSSEQPKTPLPSSLHFGRIHNIYLQNVNQICSQIRKTFLLVTYGTTHIARADHSLVIFMWGGEEAAALPWEGSGEYEEGLVADSKT